MKKDITELFVFIDDFTSAADLHFKKCLIATSDKLNKPTRTTQIISAEILTIILLYHQSPCKNFKYFYLSYLQLYKSEFPNLVSYEQFVILKPRIIMNLALLLDWLISCSKQTGISFVDATSINICHAKRISSNKVFRGFAKLSKTTKGWFFGFKLHIVINDIGEFQGVQLTKGNVDDRTPVPYLVQNLQGLLFGDKGYIKSDWLCRI